MLIGAGPIQAIGIHKAHDLGLRVVAVDGNNSAPGLALADDGIVVDIRDPKKIVSLARAFDVCGVLSIAVDAAIESVAAVGHSLGLRTLTPKAAMNATSKHRMRKCWAKANVSSPLAFSCRSFDETRDALEHVGLPAVVKPSDSAGSRGVSKVNSANELERAFSEACKFSREGIVIIETYLEGVELSVEGVAHDGQFKVLCLSDKMRTPPPHLLDTAVLFPSTQPDAVQRKAMKLVAGAVSALEIDWAPIHAEVMVSAEGNVSMVELAARGPGFKVFTEMIPWVCGVDVVEQQIRMAAGLEYDWFPTKRRGAVLEFPPATPGYVTKVDGMDECQAIPGIHDLEIYVKTGKRVYPLDSGARRVGHIIAMTETRSAAEAAVERALRTLQIKTDSSIED